MNKKRKFGCIYRARSTVERLPIPDHDLTKDEAAELKNWEEGLFACAHKFGVAVDLTLRFPEETE